MDCDAQENLDMKKLVDEWGWDWFGRYHAILGKVGMLVTDKQQTFALQTNNGQPFPVKLLANDLSTTVERLNSFCDFLSDNRLIDEKAWKKKSLIYCPKMRERADEYTKKLLTKSRHSPDQEVEEEVDTDKKKIKKNREPVVAVVVDVPTELIDTWEEFRAHRKEIKKPMTGRAEKLLLENLRNKSPDIAKLMIQQSIAHGWQGIFELKENGNGAYQSGNGRGSQARSVPTRESAQRSIEAAQRSIDERNRRDRG